MLTTQLEDLDFADDICLTSHHLSDMQSKTEEGLDGLLTTQLEDLDFADDICLTSHCLSDMKSKTEEGLDGC